MSRISPDFVFTIANTPDVFLTERESPFMLALMDLTPRERRLIARQASVLAATLDLDMVDTLELLSKLGIYMVKSEILPNSKFIAEVSKKRFR